LMVGISRISALVFLSVQGPLFAERMAHVA
jgi:hypothetical protein